MTSLRLVSPLVRSTPRGEDRARTLTGVFASVFRVVIWVVAVLAILGELDINLVPFVATATVIGAAVGFGAQTLVKDFLSGMLILAEDQYGVGDNIVVGSGDDATTGRSRASTCGSPGCAASTAWSGTSPTGTSDRRQRHRQRQPGRSSTSSSRTAPTWPRPEPWPRRPPRDRAGSPTGRTSSSGQPVFAGVQATDQNGVDHPVMAWTKPGQHFRVGRELRLRVLERLAERGWPGDRPAPWAVSGSSPAN